MNEFDTWAVAKGFDPATLTAEQKVTLQSLWRSEANPVPQPTPAPTPTATPPATTAESFDSIIADARAEQDRRTAITRLVQASLTENPDQIQAIENVGRRAIDGRWTRQETELALLRASRGNGPTMYSTSAPTMSNEVIEAAACQSLKLPTTKFDDRTLQAAHSNFKHGIGLQEILYVVARSRGYRGSHRDLNAIFRHCDPRSAEYAHGGMQASGGPSTYSLPGILGNIANTVLLNSYNFVEQSWRGISAITPVDDFKEITSYRLTDAMKIEEVPAGGELKHGTVSELSYSNQAKQYGGLFVTDRKDIINDSLSAFAKVYDALARACGEKFNQVFWKEWLNDSTFAPTDDSNDNYTAGTNTALSLTALDLIDSKFAMQQKPDGSPIGVIPRILLVPRQLRATAANLMNGTITAAAQSTPTLTLNNAFSGQYDVVSSVYLGSSAMSGYSTTAWWLLASPQDLPAIESVFLNGNEQPTVESTSMDFDRLGIVSRAVFDFGCKKQDFRAVQKAKGVA